MAVVMVDEDANDLLEMLAVEDQEPIQTLRPNRPYDRCAIPIAIPSLWKTLSKFSVNF